MLFQLLPLIFAEPGNQLEQLPIFAVLGDTLRARLMDLKRLVSPLLAERLPAPFQAPPPGDADDPWPEARRLAELAQSLIRAKEYILGEVLGIREVPCVVVADGPNYGRKLVVEYAVGGFVACDYGSYEFLFAQFGQREILKP
jgi:hypothetical protein